MTSNASQAQIERLRAIIRGEIELNSPDLPLASAEEWRELGLSGERTYANFNPLGDNSPKQPKPSKKKSPPRPRDSA